MIGLSPLPTGHPLRFQPKWVRPSTGSYSRFSLPMGRSPGFASTMNYYAPCSDSLSLRLASKLNLAAHRNSLAHSTKGTPSHQEVLRLLVGARFQALFHSPLGVLFTFPSRYLSTIGHRRVLSLRGWSPWIPTGFHVSGGTWDGGSRGLAVSRTGLSPCTAELPSSFRYRSPLQPGRGCRPPGCRSRNTSCSNALSLSHAWV